MSSYPHLLIYVFFQKHFFTKLSNAKKKKTAKPKRQVKLKKAARMGVTKEHPTGPENIQKKLVRAALKKAELLRAQEKSAQAANMVYGNDENIGIR